MRLATHSRNGETDGAVVVFEIVFFSPVSIYYAQYVLLLRRSRLPRSVGPPSARRGRRPTARRRLRHGGRDALSADAVT